MPAVLANGPIGFTDSGQQKAIPLPDLYFDASGLIKVDKWPPYNSSTTALKNSIDAWLQHLVRNGDLVKDTQQPPAAAMVITAKDPGAAGNSIKLVVSNLRAAVANPPNQTFAATLTQPATHTRLT